MDRVFTLRNVGVEKAYESLIGWNRLKSLLNNLGACIV